MHLPLLAETVTERMSCPGTLWLHAGSILARRVIIEEGGVVHGSWTVYRHAPDAVDIDDDGIVVRVPIEPVAAHVSARPVPAIPMPVTSPIHVVDAPEPRTSARAPSARQPSPVTVPSEAGPIDTEGKVVEMSELNEEKDGKAESSGVQAGVAGVVDAEGTVPEVTEPAPPPADAQAVVEDSKIESDDAVVAPVSEQAAETSVDAPGQPEPDPAPPASPPAVTPPVEPVDPPAPAARAEEPAADGKTEEVDSEAQSGTADGNDVSVLQQRHGVLPQRASDGLTPS